MTLVDKINQTIMEQETELADLSKLKAYLNSLDYSYSKMFVDENYAHVTVITDKTFPFNVAVCKRYFKKLGIENFNVNNHEVSFTVLIDEVEKWSK